MRSFISAARYMLLIVFALSFRAMAQQQETESQFNGLDYILQKPAGNEKYGSKKFGDHLFFTGEAGIMADRSHNRMFIPAGIGARAGLTVGDWFTPVHGIRLGLNAGLHNGSLVNPYFAGLSVDYLMNLTALLHKDNPSRIFELIGVAGGEYQLLYHRRQWTNGGGFRLGLQTRFNFSPLTFFYLEPRFGVYSDGIDGVETWMNYDWEASLMAGFGYRLLPAPVRRNALFLGVDQGFFISAAGGVSSTIVGSSDIFLDPGATAMLAIGTRFTSISSLRLSALVKYLGSEKSSLGAQLDYLFNLHTLFGGYDPSRVFELSGLLGAGYHAVATGGPLNGQWSGGAGLHGEFRLSNQWSLFLEPRVDVFPNGVWKDGLSLIDPLPSMLAGVTFYPVSPSIDRKSIEEDEFDFPKPIGNLYVTLGGGFAGVLQSSFSEPFPNKGYRLFGGLGTWWNPVSGVRGTLNFTSINAPRSLHNTLAAGAQLDYLLNFSSLFGGYDRSRLFEISGVAGLNYDYVSSEGYFRHSFGLGVGLQGSFRINEMFDLFVEPRLNVNQNDRWSRYFLSSINADVVPTITAGLSYNLYGYGLRHGLFHKEQEEKKEFSNESAIDHMFYGAGVGAASILHRGLFSEPLDRIGPMATFYLGKWFTAASGARLLAGGGLYGDSRQGHRKFGLVQLDYLWNINTTLYGYNPSRIFQTTLGVGAVLSYATGNHTGFYPGLGLSLQGLWKVGSGIGLFVEPQLRAFGKKYSREGIASLPVDMLTSVNVGLQYQLDRYDYKASHAAHDLSDKYFLSFAYTGRWLRQSGAFAKGYGASIMFGKWYTPLSAWRLGGDYGYYSASPRYMALSVSADYLFNLSAFTAGYNSDRLFEVLLLGGVYGGVGNSERQNRFEYGVRAGVQGRFNVSSGIDLFVEPQLVAAHIPHSYNNVDPEARLLVGLNYKLGKDVAAREDRKAPAKPSYLSFTIGPSMFSETILLDRYRKVSTGIDFSYGRWLTAVSGVEVGMSYDFIDSRMPKTLNLGTLHADYMLNFNSLFDADPDRRFHLIGSVGTGFGWSNYDSEGGIGWMAQAGLQLRWNVSSSVDLFVKPSMTLWDDKLYENNTHHFVGVGRVSLGAAYRF